MNKKQKSLKINFVMNAVLSVSSFIFPLITFPYISRILLPVGTGKVSFATSLITYFNMFAQLGIPTYGIRACAKVRDDKEKLTRTAQELLFINLLMACFSYIALFVAITWVPKLREERNLYLIMSFTIFLSAVGMEWLYKALEQYSYITIRSIITKALAMIAMFLLVHEEKDYVIYGGISVAASSASYIFNFFNASKFISTKPIGNYDCKRHLKPILVFFAMSCATTIYVNLDTVMLGFMTTESEVGFYNAAVKIKIILVEIVTSLGAVLLPRSSYYVQEGLLNEFRRITQKALNFVLLFASSLMLYFILFAKEGILFISGNAYEGAVLPMQIIMPTLLLIGITNVLGVQMLVPLGREKIVLYSTVGGAIIDLILNTLLIPHFLSSGAALGTLAAEVTVLIIQAISLKKIGLLSCFNGIDYYKIIISLLLAGLASLWIKVIDVNNFMKLLISSIVFFGIYVSALLIMKEKFAVDIYNQIIKKIWRKVTKRRK